ncbi:hypothetical protein [Pseudonocardia sp. TRM90224]|uniref:hypothetical protein n=1 Tax=Pseudonocardia sp. TRM90224 TaxID=2812678 RepID=UPI001E52CFC1|nr:hypothetical protein [Pseudonocardia sp. TRM90224]
MSGSAAGTALAEGSRPVRPRGPVRVVAAAVGTVLLVAMIFWARMLAGGDGVLWPLLVGVVTAGWIVAAAVGRSSAGRTVLAALVAALLAPILVLAGGFGWLAVEGSGGPGAATRGGDALWMGHAWVDGRRGPADVDALAALVRETGIRDLYVHAGPFADDGTLDPTLRPSARWLVEAVHAAAPGVRVQAWLGNVVADDRLRLDDPATRARVLQGVRAVLADGFDGVHYDFEPVASGNAAYLELLTATRAVTRASGAILSAAVNQVEMVAGMHLPGQLAFGRPHWWSFDYFAAVAREVDQVAMMSYDTGVPFEIAYSGYVAVQTRLATQAVPDGVELLMGVPAFRDGVMHTGAETVAAAVRGIRVGLGAAPDRPVGAAVYVDFDATEADWAQYRSGWAEAG